MSVFVDARGRKQPVERRQSPPICGDCLLQHSRLDRHVRRALRIAVEGGLEQSPTDVQEYALAMFDHLTLGTKVSGPDVPQRYPAPRPPAAWPAPALALVNRLVLFAAHGLPAA